MDGVTRSKWAFGDSNGARAPTDYAVTSHDLLYYPRLGLEVSTPVGRFLSESQSRCPLRIDDGFTFRDPRETTYSKYVELQSAKERTLADQFSDARIAEHDRRLPTVWTDLLDALLGPLRFPLHGLQMVACYVGQAVPDGRVTIACALTAADEIRQIQSLTRRVVELRKTHPGFGETARALWQADARWQPLRRLVEQLLVTYDWAEALTALGLVVLPMLDALLSSQLRERAERSGDGVLAALLDSFSEDARWHADWVRELALAAVRAAPENREHLVRWVQAWQPRATEALSPISELLDATGSSVAFLVEAQVELTRTAGVS